MTEVRGRKKDIQHREVRTKLGFQCAYQVTSPEVVVVEDEEGSVAPPLLTCQALVVAYMAHQIEFIDVSPDTSKKTVALQETLNDLCSRIAPGF